MGEPIIHFDYDFSPYGQKTKLLLEAGGVQFQKCDQPVMLPRPDLEALGITFRRIPLLAIGKDIYCDSALIVSTIMSKLIKPGSVPTTPVDKAFEEWGHNAFAEVLGLVPLKALTPDFVKDRETIFPILKRPDLKQLRPSALAGFQSRLREMENVFLADFQGPFRGGDKLSLAEIHCIFGLRWAFNDLGVAQDAGCGKENFPKIWKLIENLPQSKPEVLSAEETHKRIRGAGYTADGPTSVMKDDPLGISQGSQVTVESFDAAPGAHVQAGKLIGTGPDELVIEVNDGIRLHFPKIGYVVKTQEKSQL